MSAREIKFKGISLKGELIQGDSLIRRQDWNGTTWHVRYFLLNGHSCNCTADTASFAEIDPETLVEYIGLKDKNEIEAYQGDIVKDPFSGMTWLISYHENGRWYLETVRSDCEHWASISIDHLDDFEIIGNEFQNPELLESA